MNGLFFLLLIFNLPKTELASLGLFHTENRLDTQSYDCIYYTDETVRQIDTTPYCIRTNESIVLNRSFLTNTCENSGQEWTFKQLKERNVSQEEVLRWNSSLEMADRYAAYLTTGDAQFTDEKICNCSSNTFGKFCEYQFMTQNSFEDTIQYQFYLKKEYRNGSQLWGNITCYTNRTDCDFGLRCLTWQNICDRKQHCMYGIDEDRCDELEYNECEENEYRCQDGSCIPEEYWLDGQIDCSDESDEQTVSARFSNGLLCAFTPSQFICDEATAHYDYFACGDGEFILESLPIPSSCYNYRNLIYFCELPADSYDMEPGKWTLENGHCVENGWIEKTFTDMTESEKCVFYLKCLLTEGKNDHCIDIMDDFASLCENTIILYPPAPVIRPYVQTLYVPSELEETLIPSSALFDGSIKCVGQQTSSKSNLSPVEWLDFMFEFSLESFFCHQFGTMNFSDSQLHQHCWHDTKQSFLCEESLQCISKRRLRNNIQDCEDGSDESDGQKCFMTKQHRLNCTGNQSLCLFVSQVGDRKPDCKEGNDEYIRQLKWDLHNHQCEATDSQECTVLKSYIRSPSSVTMIEKNEVLLFRQYCDTLWHLSKGFDELFCNNWKCPENYYQCLSGHCVPEYVLNDSDLEWDCPDGSDDISLLRITNLSEHNARLFDSDFMNKLKIELTFANSDHSRVPFTIFCDASTEYGCILANVINPLNFTLNRPCIKIEQIGDGAIDCYGGLDERNILSCGDQLNEQRGFDFHCSDQECIPYHQLCEKRCSNHADDLLCEQLQTFWNSTCAYSHQFICADFTIEVCDLAQVSRYYCDILRRSLDESVLPYRLNSWTMFKREILLSFLEYPNANNAPINYYHQPSQYQSINDHSDVSYIEENDGREGWICGRGVAIKTNTGNQVQCFCPPSLYGEFCQYYSDRITVIISFQNIPTQLLERPSTIIKILAILLSNDEIVDQHVFHLPLAFPKEWKRKFRFNLIHRRPKVWSDSYAVRFEAYHLSDDSSIKFVSVWEYSVEFPFLPSYRLVQILRFAKDATSIPTGHVCRTANPCSHHSTCHPIINRINNMSAYHCHCTSNSIGKHCEHLSQSTTSSMCSEHALQRWLSPSKSICLCSSHRFGPTCYLNHTCVNLNPCGLNRGKCYTNPDNLTRDYICICDKKFFGDHCEFDSALVRIAFTGFSFVQTPSNFILSSIVQLFDLHKETLDVILRQKRVYQGLPPSITEVYHNDHQLPSFGLVKFYHKHDAFDDYVANLKQPDYFILYIATDEAPGMNITSVISKTNYCPYTLTVFQKNLSHSSYLSEFITSSQVNATNNLNTALLVFQYHSLCDAPYSLMCFHDDHYFCLCDKYRHAECSRYDSTLDECSGRCRARGQCIHGDLDDRRDFVCLCPRCYHGSICQHNTELFSFTLETLLTNDLYSSSLVIQRIFTSLLIIVPAILVLIGAVNNVCCYVTFNRTKPLIVGAGHYLRAASIINELTLFMLLFKLIHLALSIRSYVVHPLTNTILCKVLSYLLACTSRMSYWLMGMVAIERVYVTWYLKGTWLKSPRIAKRIISGIIIGIVAANVHELIYYQSIEDPKSLDAKNSTWCVTSYPSSIATYNQVNIILNYIIPFLINLVSTIILIVSITRKRATATVKKAAGPKSESNMRLTIRTYVNLFSENKELILAPLVTMFPQLFALPQFILSFSLACQEFNVSWQRYLLLISYCITYFPQVLSYKLYVSPSSFYTNEFHATKLYDLISRWRVRMQSNTERIVKD